MNILANLFFRISNLIAWMLLINNALFAQNIANATSSPVCENSGLGKIIVSIDDEELSGTNWSYPFLLQYLEVNSGAVDLIELNNDIQIIVNQPAGEYELTLYLDESCLYTFDVIVPFSPEITMIPPGVVPPNRLQ